jgi:hypothetical protein
MAMQILFLFNRLGIFATIDNGFMADKATSPCYKILVLGGEINRFRDVIKLNGYKGKILESIVVTRDQNNFSDRISLENTKLLTDLARDAGMSISQLGYRFQNNRINQKYLKVALDNYRKFTGKGIIQLEWLINPNLVWDVVTDITDVGEADVFDRCVPNRGNYVVNGIVVHNSGDIEQDADVVIFISRPWMDGITEDKDGSCTEFLTVIQVEKNRNGKAPLRIKARNNERVNFYSDWDVPVQFTRPVRDFSEPRRDESF